MMPILYAANETAFDTLGLGVLNDCISCEVYEELNGEFELTMRYPVNGVLFDELAVDKIILAKPSQTRQPQAFRIYCVKKSSNASAVIRAEHISYRLKDIPVKNFGASTLGRAIEAISKNSLTENPFTISTTLDTAAVKTFSFGEPRNLKSILIDEENSFLTAYGGEFEFDNYSVILKEQRGADNGFKIAYAKNMTGIVCEESVEDVYTACVAFYRNTDADGYPVLVVGELQTIETHLSYSRAIIYDATDEHFDYIPPVEHLNISARDYLATLDNEPYLMVSVDFVNLGDSEEYKQFRQLEVVDLGDVVKIYHPDYKIDIAARVVATTYNVLLERYSSVDVGRRKTNIADSLSGLLAKLV